MPRQRFQRPEVRKMGTGRKQQWGCDYFVYVRDGEKERRVHKVGRFGLCSKVQKAKAQQACDRFMIGVNGGVALADPTMTLATWWEEVYKPIRGRRWSYNTRVGYASTWRCHIEPHLGSKRLVDINKIEIDRLMLRLADAGLSEQMVERVLVMLHGMLEEAVDNDVIAKNPTRRVEVPNCKKAEETRSLTVDEVHQLWNSLQEQDYLIFRVMLLCGPRPNECFALKREDYVGNALRFDESVSHEETRFGSTKNRKSRCAPVPASLKAELDAWLEKRPPDAGALIFAGPRGGPMSHDGYGRRILARARKASKIADLNFRMCRTTFATLYDGDLKDAQEILGHHSAEFTLNRYRKPLPERAAAASEELDARLSAKVIPFRKGA
ncbi:MAG TPA: tyrosine-type recombinase/integrase [Candidatus Limnocylindrales bacterium]|nr:tyrosine-type recombinase/integrase [Candidatus Limnocylindrales bacterium]